MLKGKTSTVWKKRNFLRTHFERPDTHRGSGVVEEPEGTKEALESEVTTEYTESERIRGLN